MLPTPANLLKTEKEEIFYEFYFAQISASHGLPINQFYLPGSAIYNRSKGQFSFTRCLSH